MTFLGRKSMKFCFKSVLSVIDLFEERVREFYWLNSFWPFKKMCICYKFSAKYNRWWTVFFHVHVSSRKALNLLKVKVLVFCLLSMSNQFAVFWPTSFWRLGQEAIYSFGYSYCNCCFIDYSSSWKSMFFASFIFCLLYWLCEFSFLL